MRTWFEIEETDVYLTVRETLLRRCEAWAAAHGLAMAPSLAEALLDSRHFSTDGRLGYWTPAQVERALLDWIPGKVTAAPEDLLGAPETLRSLLRYLEATGLRDPRGATAAENEAAIDAAAAEFNAAIADPDRYGLAKTMALAAGLDKPEAAIEAFLQGGPETLADVDPEVVKAAMARQARLPALNAERKMPQLPVSLPAREELAAAAGRSKVVRQFRALAEWLGPQGRALTTAKNIRPADARELVTLLGTGEEGLKFRSAAELPGLNLVVSWALEARIIRRQGTRLLPVAKARPLLANAEALWQRAFEAAFAIGAAACPPIWADEPPSPVQRLYDVIVPDVLASIYSMEEPVPVPRLAASVWQTVESRFDLDSLSPLGLMGLRGRADNDVDHIFDAFEALGAVASARGMASGVFSQDPDGEDGPFRGGEAAELRRQLAGPVRLVSLTPLGTRAMRERMLAEGREAALVGELAGAAPAEMLGVVAEHYTNASAAEEIARWREAHGASLDPLVQAIDDCPFVTRRVALLQTLASAVPEGPQLLDNLARDPAHRPVVLLARRPGLRPPDATPEEATWMMIGTLLELLELGGPEAVTGQLAQFPPGQRKEFARTVVASGFPVPETLEEFRSLVAAPLLHGPPRPHPTAHVTRTQHTRPKRPRRR